MASSVLIAETPSQLLAMTIRKRRKVVSSKNPDFHRGALLGATIKLLCREIGRERAYSSRLPAKKPVPASSAPSGGSTTGLSLRHYLMTGIKQPMIRFPWRSQHRACERELTVVPMSRAVQTVWTIVAPSLGKLQLPVLLTTVGFLAKQMSKLLVPWRWTLIIRTLLA
jgi:hypothetical protein